MKNIDVINSFMMGKYAKTTNLESVGSKLINYKTVIAWFGDEYLNENPDTVYVNYRYYSHTTRCIQNKIIDIANKQGIPCEIACK